MGVVRVTGVRVLAFFSGVGRVVEAGDALDAVAGKGRCGCLSPHLRFLFVTGPGGADSGNSWNDFAEVLL